VHFNVHMDPSKGETLPEQIEDVLMMEIGKNDTNSVLGELVIDGESLDIQGEHETINCFKVLICGLSCFCLRAADNQTL
jgi:hypothetical protein